MPAENSVSVDVVRAVAAKKGVDAVELNPPLYEVINPEALDMLFRGTTGRLTFDYLGYTVTITHDHDIDVSD